MDAPLLLATDLDRTLLPNGAEPESSMARAYFHRLAARPEVRLAYVTGRHRELVQVAMAEYALPTPDFVIADVGTTLYEIHGDDWHVSADWHRAIAADWGGRGHDALAALLCGVPGLCLQEAAKQGACKLSYYAAPLADPADLLARVGERLAAGGARVNLVWSVDETSATGLLDVLPAGASKLHALEFLRARLALPVSRTVFAGDSGNDMEVLTSGLPAVLVANAQDTVRAEAVARAPAGSLYLARGGLLGMNGNYCAGLLEGLVHFVPESHAWLEEAVPGSNGEKKEDHP